MAESGKSGNRFSLLFIEAGGVFPRPLSFYEKGIKAKQVALEEIPAIINQIRGTAASGDVIFIGADNRESKPVAKLASDPREFDQIRYYNSKGELTYDSCGLRFQH